MRLKRVRRVLSPWSAPLAAARIAVSITDGFPQGLSLGIRHAPPFAIRVGLDIVAGTADRATDLRPVDVLDLSAALVVLVGIGGAGKRGSNGTEHHSRDAHACQAAPTRSGMAAKEGKWTSWRVEHGRWQSWICADGSLPPSFGVRGHGAARVCKGPLQTALW
jgi:hypothetical protein